MIFSMTLTLAESIIIVSNKWHKHSFSNIQQDKNKSRYVGDTVTSNFMNQIFNDYTVEVEAQIQNIGL